MDRPAVTGALVGTRGLYQSFHEFDPRPGGRWHFVMHAPNGTDYQNESSFVEIVKLEHIVFQHLKPIHKFEVTATFEDLGGGTKLTWRMLFDSSEECDKVKAFISKANEQNLDKLDAQLAKAPSTHSASQHSHA